MTLELIGTILTVVGLLVGGAWALVKGVVRQLELRLDERFAAQATARAEGAAQWSERFSKFEEHQRVLERDFLIFKADLPIQYVRREDAIRRDTILDAKLDAMNARLDLVLERAQAGRAIGG